MSHSFYIHGVGDARLDETLAALPFDDLVTDAQNDDGSWPEIAHIHQDKVSVRAIETAMAGGTLQVRIMANSSPDDFGLAAAIVDHVAGKFGKDIEPEDNASMSLEQWRETYGPDWQRQHAIEYLQMLVGMYKDPDRGGNLRMWGTNAEFEVGPRLMEPLLEDPENFSKNFFARFRRLNYLHQEDVFGPSLLAIKQKDSDKQAVFSVLGQDVVTALSNQAAFIVMNHADIDELKDNDGSTTITFDDFAEIAGDTLTWLGDGVAVTPPYQRDDWQKLLAAAEQRATDFFDHPHLLRDADEGRDNGQAGAGGDGPLGIAEQH